MKSELKEKPGISDQHQLLPTPDFKAKQVNSNPYFPPCSPVAPNE